MILEHLELRRDIVLNHLDTARPGAKRGYDKLQDNLESPQSFIIPA